MEPRVNSAEPAADAHIVVSNLTLAYGDFVVQRNLDFTVRRGEIFIVMGGSGCGKSTLLKTMVGLLRPAGGDVHYDGEPFWAGGEAAREARKRTFGVLFQSGALWSGLTLAENVALPLRQLARLPEDVIDDLCRLKLALVGLSGFEDYLPSEISGGMRKRAGLARAMALDPEILFFDEPSAGLDPVNSRLLDELMLEISGSLRTTLVVVTHELPSIFAIGDNAVFLDAAARTQLAVGNPRELRDNCTVPAVRDFLHRLAPEAAGGKGGMLKDAAESRSEAG